MDRRLGALQGLGEPRLRSERHRSLKGREAQAVTHLFQQEAEVYNLELIARVKAFFPNVYNNEQIHQLLIPYTHRVPKWRLEQMIEARDLPTLASLFKQSNVNIDIENLTLESLPTSGSGALFRYARRMLHLSAAPNAALACFVSLAKLIRQEAKDRSTSPRSAKCFEMSSPFEA